MRRRQPVLILCFALLSVVPAAAEEAEEPGLLTRFATSFGGGLTLGDGLSPGDLGYSAVFGRTIYFFEPRQVSGFYFGLPSRTQRQQAGRIVIGDTRWVSLGWRGAVGAPWLGLDANLALVLGSRFRDRDILGAFYLGLQPGFGIYFPYDQPFDVGLAVEPNLVFLRLFGSKETRNQSYLNVSLFVTLKQLDRVVDLPWTGP